MAERDAPPPVAPDPRQPSVARVNDYYLGGSHNFAVDRDAAERLATVLPAVPYAVRAQRGFLRRAVRFITGSGVTQFLDLGAGIPTQGNILQVAESVAPDCRVVYVDSDPVATAYSRALTADDHRVGCLQADLRDTKTVLASPEVSATLDLSRPLAVMVLGVLHLLPDPAGTAASIARYRDAVAPGSFLVVSVALREPDGESELAARIRSLGLGTELHPWHRAEVEQLFDGFELVEPGLVQATRWRPDNALTSDTLAGRVPGLVGVGRKL